EDEFLRHRLCVAHRRKAPGGGLLPRQPGQRRGRTGGAESEPGAGTRGKDGVAMRIVIKFAGALLEDAATVRSLAQAVPIWPGESTKSWWSTGAGVFSRIR